MTDLRRTPELHNLLHSVAEAHIVHHSGTCGAWPRGWSWSTGGHMTEQDQQDVDDLWHARLITFDSPADPCGNRCKLTFAGSERLSEWDTRWPAAPQTAGGTR
jgi:hypothetical protein